MKFPFFALRRGASFALTLLVALALVACAPADGDGDGAGDADGGGTEAVANGAVEITSDNHAFDAATIEAPAGEAFTITLVNNDTEPHNISVFTEQGGEAIVEGEIINQGETVEVEVPALDAGEYYFHCDVHPDMNGTVNIEG